MSRVVAISSSKSAVIDYTLITTMLIVDDTDKRINRRSKRNEFQRNKTKTKFKTIDG